MAVIVGPYSFSIDPNSVKWDYSVKTAVRETLGGVVVQVFGTRLGDITVGGQFGQNGADDLQHFVDTMQLLMESQMEKSEALPFSYPSRGWNFPVFIKNVRSDKSGSVYRDSTTLAYGYTLTLLPDTQDPRLVASATDDFLNRLMGDGLGWKASTYNGPQTVDEVKATLAGEGYSSIDEMAAAATQAVQNPDPPSTQAGDGDGG